MTIEPTGLPPRGSRKKQTRSPVSLKKLLQSGLVLFGALFFGLIGIELYQAKMTHPSAAEGTPVVNAEKPTDVQGAPASEQTTAALPAAARQPAQPAPSVTEPPTTKPSAEAAPSTAAAPSAVQIVGSAPPKQAGIKEATGKTTSVSKPVTDARKAEAPIAKASEKPKAVKHVVQKGETLYMLSRKYYGNNSSVARIANYNGMSLEAQLTAGTVVMVPISK
ncbi:LysM peptidoglycan-binding domain-containing protein [Brevibacillus choshinensis]|uniref:LysM peptidoglycan-binding domain-containing protein n=1 Tax=Brevibacillus choshinensis TaxID=54911 RepID=A0ABX7FWL1_BRECH|nr:LysM domain-containing protein [Brevibacillus choshinensis]QRG69877.1 LysM peptidoglycan-binding domain-containing protein [Brevibacillus choshinensis]